MLYIVATPIGNLQDFSPRAVSVLESSSYILAEDTRHSRTLLDHYLIKTPLVSFHSFNEKSRENTVLEDLKSGKTLSLISDAGTPGICDPGEDLVRACREAKIPVSAVPGPCAFILALALSSFSKARVQFLGFLPSTQEKLKIALMQSLTFRGTSVFYEAPHRLLKTLETLAALDPSRRLSIHREMTKKFEECLEASAEEMLELFKKTAPRGEFVVLVEEEKEVPPHIPLALQVEKLQKTFGLSRADAIRTVAELNQIPKREIYNLLCT